MKQGVRRSFLFVCATVCALAFLFPPARAETPASLDEYRAAVAHALALVAQANALPATERAPLLAQATVELDRVNPVRLPSGTEVRVDNAALHSLLENANNTEQALARLTALRRAVDAPLTFVNPSDLSALQAILSRPPFTSNTSINWLAELLNRLRDFLSRLVFNTAQGIFDARDLVILVGVAVVAGVLVYFVRNLRRNVVPEQALALPPEDKLAETSRQAFEKAQQLIAAGDYRAAVRQLYLATLLLLDERGRIKFDRSLTNREVLKHASNDPRIATALEPIVTTFDRTWYGFESLTDAEFADYRVKVEAVKEL